MALDFPGTLSLSNLDKLRIDAAVDKSIRQRLTADPKGLLKERGIDVPKGVKVAVVEDTMNTYTITLPPFVGSDLSKQGLTPNVANNTTTACTTCIATSIICMGSIASLTCTGAKAR